MPENPYQRRGDLILEFFHPNVIMKITRYFHISNYACFSALGHLWPIYRNWSLDCQNDIVRCTLLRRFQGALNNLCILIQTQIMPNLVFWAQIPKYGNSASDPPNCYIFRCLLSLHFQRAFNHYPSIIFGQIMTKCPQNHCLLL